MGEEQAIEQTVRSYFEALFGKNGEPSDFATPQLAFIEELSNAVAERVGEKWADHAYAIERAEVSTISGHWAEVDLDAWSSAVVTIPGERADADYRATGPAIVQRTHDGWRLADFFLNGFPLVRESFVAVEETLALGGLELTPLAVQRRAGATFLYLRVANRTDESATLGKLRARTRPWGAFEAFLPGVTFAPGEETSSGAIFDPRLPVRGTLKIEVTAHIKEGPQKSLLRVHLKRASVGD